ncbi:MAG: beta-N-acetylhexosaminidase [Thiohalomonadaceae bacterium]
MSLGPVMVDLRGTALMDDERELLRHPNVGGVILFTRNFESAAQIAELVQQIHAVREPRLLVCVDHEGGRVQRFRSGFTRLPPARVFGQVYDRNPRRARLLAEAAGWVMASELRAVGVDFSFAPVLDLDRGISTVIGDRAFHSNPEAVADLAGAYVQGMRKAGMAATGKHFPGHGGVAADSHVAIPVDERELSVILEEDVLPFRRLFAGGLAAVMPAHVIYPHADAQPAGFSAFWLQEVLRRRLGFQGLVFSDDLSMEGASVAGDYVDRAGAAMAAGCDMVLVCNCPQGAAQVVEGLRPGNDPVAHARMARMHGRHGITPEELHSDHHWYEAREAIARLADDPTQELHLA